MTENEAKEWLREMQNPMISEAELYCAETCYGLGKMVYPEPEDYVFEVAIQALEEIQQYRAIGTIEEFKELKEKNEPIKPVKIKLASKYGSKAYICARCNELIGWKQKHCNSCGSEFDWQ